jgi:metal-dependent hydrolase (beta-lactamase superfamily II)
MPYVCGVYDGGTQKYGEALVTHLKKYYFVDTENPTIDFVICSHSDQDHASGLSALFDNFKIDALIVNRPWLYIDDIWDKVTDGRITKSSLESRLKEAYPYVKTLEEKANKAGTQIYEGFQGTKIYTHLRILSPTKEFYTKLLIESNKTPLSESTTHRMVSFLAY